MLESNRRTTRSAFYCSWILCLFSIGGISAFSYIGCYKDDYFEYDMTGPYYTITPSYTVTQCISGCLDAGYPYCGIQGGNNRCFCGTNYGKYGFASDCDMVCVGLPCGGQLSNSVYYVVDTLSANQRSLSYVAVAQSFDVARMECVSHGGDLPSINNEGDLNRTIDAVLNGGNLILKETLVWIGMRQNQTTVVYDWIDPTSPRYGSADSDLFVWKEEAVKSPCVLLDVLSAQWETAPCGTPFTFVCFSIPWTDSQDSSDSTDGSSNSNSPLVLYIVLPLFLLCYGGSCLVFCAHKIHRNCRHINRCQSKMDLAESGPMVCKLPANQEERVERVRKKKPLSARKKSLVHPEPTGNEGPRLDRKAYHGNNADTTKTMAIKKSEAISTSSNLQKITDNKPISDGKASTLDSVDGVNFQSTKDYESRSNVGTADADDILLLPSDAKQDGSSDNGDHQSMHLEVNECGLSPRNIRSISPMTETACPSLDHQEFELDRYI